MQNIDTQAYVVAVNRRRVGVAVTAGQGFRFIAADPEFRPLDGSSFRHLAQLEQAAERLAKMGRGQADARACQFRHSHELLVDRSCRAQPHVTHGAAAG